MNWSASKCFTVVSVDKNLSIGWYARLLQQINQWFVERKQSFKEEQSSHACYADNCSWRTIVQARCVICLSEWIICIVLYCCDIF